MSHFASVGFPIYEAQEAEQVLSVAFERAVEAGAVAEYAEGRTATYRDPSAALLAIHTDTRGNFQCCAPGFEGAFLGSWRPVGVVADPGGCRFCDLVYAELLDGGEMVYPLAVRVESIGAERALIPYGEPGEVRFAGLWEEGEVWPDEAAFHRAQEAQWAHVPVPEDAANELGIRAFGGFASRSLLPSGTFAFEGGAMTPHAIAHGLVASVEERQNELGDARFLVVRLDTLGGVFDTCLAPGTIEGEELLVPGAVARATLWLVGRPLTLRDQPGPVPQMEESERPGLVRRLFRK
jgi:hypothetical protein